jgi:hypothetical protein
MLIRMHEATAMSIQELRELMGDTRRKYGLSDAEENPKPVDKDVFGQPSSLH